jgi:hypothetical protein
MKRRLLFACFAIALLLLAVGGWAVHALDPQPHRERGTPMT